jgi:hypothetical protein
VNLKAQLQKLERRHSQIERERFRMVVSHAGKPFDLATATCTRTLMQDGGLIEIVNVNGSGHSDGTRTPTGIRIEMPPPGHTRGAKAFVKR